jgi:hypothetical protein
VIIDCIGARARLDSVRAAAPVDGRISGAGHNDVGSRGTCDRQRGADRRCIQILEVVDSDGVADRLIAAWRDHEIDGRRAARGERDQRVGASPAVYGKLAAAIVDEIVAGACIDRVGAAAAVDRIGACAAED